MVRGKTGLNQTPVETCAKYITISNIISRILLSQSCEKMSKPALCISHLTNLLNQEPFSQCYNLVSHDLFHAGCSWTLNLNQV